MDFQTVKKLMVSGQGARKGYVWKERFDFQCLTERYFG
jgi:hypothetical protein